MFKPLLTLLFISLASIMLSGCLPDSNVNNKTVENKEDTMFEVAEGSSMTTNYYKPLDKDLLGKECTFFGKLTDTGELNLFYTYSFDGTTSNVRRYYLKNRIYKDPSNFCWVKITGKYSNVDPDKDEIDAVSYEKVGQMDEKIEKAVSYSTKWVAENKASYDLNKYKSTQRFHMAFESLKDSDFNKTEFSSGNELVFIDYDKMIIGIDVGKQILRKNEQRADYLNYIAIYDLNSMKLTKVIIRNTGYFLE